MPTNNTINYIEFPATDLDAIKTFYQTVFGWQFTDYGPTYTAFAGSGVDGGFTTDAKLGMVGSGPLVVLYHDNLEEIREEVVAHGGTICQDIFSFPGGRRFHFTDPSGNELAIWCTV